MNDKTDDLALTRSAMYRRWVYMAVAILACLFLFDKPIFSFQEDKGIIYVRSFSMDDKTFLVTQTDLTTGVKEVTDAMSVIGLYYCNKALLYGCVLCLLCFFSDRWRIAIAMMTAVIAGLYYGVVIYYSIKIADLHFATLMPTFYVFLPAIVLELMVMIRHNIIRTFSLREEAAEMD